MKKLDKVVLFIVFALLVGIIVLMTLMFVQKGFIRIGKVVVKENVIEEKKVMSENVVFLGDSITEFYDLDKYYDKTYHVQSGHSGDQTKDILGDMDNRVYRYNPSKVFINLGINNFVWGDDSAEDVVNDIKEICDKISKRNPYAEIYIESIYPYNNKWKEIGHDTARDEGFIIDRINEANKMLKKYSNEKGYKYIDIYSMLVTEDGKYDFKYTDDGLHPNEEAYKIITEEITKYLK